MFLSFSLSHKLGSCSRYSLSPLSKLIKGKGPAGTLTKVSTSHPASVSTSLEADTGILSTESAKEKKPPFTSPFPEAVKWKAVTEMLLFLYTLLKSLRTSLRKKRVNESGINELLIVNESRFLPFPNKLRAFVCSMNSSIVKEPKVPLAYSVRSCSGPTSIHSPDSSMQSSLVIPKKPPNNSCKTLLYGNSRGSGTSPFPPKSLRNFAPCAFEVLSNVIPCNSPP